MGIDSGDRLVEYEFRERERIGSYMYDHRYDYVKRSHYEEVQKRLTRAKELIKTLLLIADNKVSQMEFQLYVADAKQFLKEMENDSVSN